MDSFLSGLPPESEPDESGIAWRSTEQYVEAKYLLNGVWFPVYFITVDDGIGAAITCWDRFFDVFIAQLSNPSVANLFRRKYPAWFTAIDHSFQEAYGKGALLEAIDPDDVNKKWMIGVMFSQKSENKHEKAASAAEKVLVLSAEVLDQFARPITKGEMLKAALGGAVRGGIEGAALANRIIGAAQWLDN